MGIKGVFQEIGEVERISLTKLSIEHYEKTERPFRIAIDVAIWQFQNQAARGGSDPATRTLYFRLLRLLSTSIQPLFVFDGPNKPQFKRNRRITPGSGSASNALTKQLLTLFGFPYHQAPGEAEAECALLQRKGIVDAVLSEDIDTLMFGATLCLRKWSSEGRRGNKPPSHVSAFYSSKIKEGKSGLDREGMILVALLSGGDYIPAGVPGCGIKLACEAARAGFGKSLCAISRSNAADYKIWREKLEHEINKNESGHFRKKRKLVFPESFPNLEVLGYYTHPVVSGSSQIEKLEKDIRWDGELDVSGLRRFVAEALDWTHKPGAYRFIRGLAPALLIYKLRIRGERAERDNKYGDIILTNMEEKEIVRKICGERREWNSDGIPEIQLVYNPLDIVGLNLDAEEDQNYEICRNGLAPRNDNDEIEEYVSEDCDKPANDLRKTQSAYDPTELSKLWVPRTIVQIGVPLQLEDYERDQRKRQRGTGKRKAEKKASKSTDNDQNQEKANVSNNKKFVTHPRTHLPILPTQVGSSQNSVPTLKSLSDLRSNENNPQKLVTSPTKKKLDHQIVEKVSLVADSLTLINQDQKSAGSNTTRQAVQSFEQSQSSPVFKFPPPIHSLFDSPLPLDSSTDSSRLTSSPIMIISPGLSNDGSIVELPSSVSLNRSKGNDKSIKPQNIKPCWAENIELIERLEKCRISSSAEHDFCHIIGSENHLLLPDQNLAPQVTHSTSHSPDDFGYKRQARSPGPFDFKFEDLEIEINRKHESKPSNFSSHPSQATIIISSSPSSPRDISSPAPNFTFHSKGKATQNDSPVRSMPLNVKYQEKNKENSVTYFNFQPKKIEKARKAQKNVDKVIVLRDSLPGGWKIVSEIEEEISAKTRDQREGHSGKLVMQNKKINKWRMSEIESLDLTAS